MQNAPTTSLIRRLVLPVIIFIAVLTILVAHNSLLTFNAQLSVAILVAASALIVVYASFRGANKLESVVDIGWVAYIVLTAVTVLASSFPRRGLEIWLWTAAIQLPVYYGALYLFRTWNIGRALYRALLGAIGILLFFAVQATISYFSSAAAIRAEGLVPAGFRLFGILNHPNILAMVVAVSVPCIVGYAFTKLKRLEQIVVAVWLVGAAITLYGTGSRTGLIASFIGVLVSVYLALLARPNKPLRRWSEWGQQNRPKAIGIALGGLTALALIIFLAYQLQSGRPAQDDGGGRASFFRSAIAMAQADPVLGSGPGGFLQYEVLINSVPPVQPFAHAHNTFLTTAAESGLLGLVGLMTLLFTGRRAWRMSWQQRPHRRHLIAGPVGGLAAFLIFGLLDSPTIQPVPFFIATLLLAYVVSGIRPERYTTGLRTGLIASPAILITSLCIYTLLSYNVQWRSTGPDNPPITHEQAARELDKQIANDPYDGFMQLQSAYHWGWAATATPDYRSADATLEAIRHFEVAIKADPQLAIHRLNLAVLYLQAGLDDDALFNAQGAVQRAPLDPLAQLTMAIMQEGDSAELSSAAYIKALSLNPYWMFAEFWNETPVRRTALEKFKTSEPNAAYYVNLVAEKYDEALVIATNDGQRRYVMGLRALKANDLVGAKRAMKQITLTGTGDVQVDAWFVLGDLARQQGDQAEMLRNYWAAYHMIATRGMNGYNSLGDYGYSMIAFNRYGRITDYLPIVPRLDVSPERAASLMVLADAMVTGKFKVDQPVLEAINIYRLILQSNPSDKQAESALKALSVF
jgi:O-antigen ligase/tetratricopeptide (TPR) repeat protein